MIVMSSLGNQLQRVGEVIGGGTVFLQRVARCGVSIQCEIWH